MTIALLSWQSYQNMLGPYFHTEPGDTNLCSSEDLELGCAHCVGGCAHECAPSKPLTASKQARERAIALAKERKKRETV